MSVHGWAASLFSTHFHRRQVFSCFYVKPLVIYIILYMSGHINAVYAKRQNMYLVVKYMLVILRRTVVLNYYQRSKIRKVERTISIQKLTLLKQSWDNATDLMMSSVFNFLKFSGFGCHGESRVSLPGNWLSHQGPTLVFGVAAPLE